MRYNFQVENHYELFISADTIRGKYIFHSFSAPPKSINKEEIHACTQYLFMALEDRNADVRKGANEAVLPFMIQIGYEGMLKHVSRVKVSSPR